MQSNIILSILLGAAYLTVSAKPKEDTTIPSNFNSREISFRENKGQVYDQYFKPRTDVLFSGDNGEFSFFLKPNGISYQLKRADSWKEELNIKTKEKIQVVDQFTIYRIDFQWLNTMNDFRYYKR